MTRDLRAELVQRVKQQVFEGEPAAVDHMVAWSRTGPPRAVVSGVEVITEEPAWRTGFQIR